MTCPIIMPEINTASKHRTRLSVSCQAALHFVRDPMNLREIGRYG